MKRKGNCFLCLSHKIGNIKNDEAEKNKKRRDFSPFTKMEDFTLIGHCGVGQEVAC